MPAAKSAGPRRSETMLGDGRIEPRGLGVAERVEAAVSGAASRGASGARLMRDTGPA
jgi:hypothetical protein